MALKYVPWLTVSAFMVAIIYPTRMLLCSNVVLLKMLGWLRRLLNSGKVVSKLCYSCSVKIQSGIELLNTDQHSILLKTCRLNALSHVRSVRVRVD